MDGKQLIRQAVEIAGEKGLSQAEWSRRAGYDEFGKIISNTLKRGDCKLKVMTQLLKPLGCRLTIVKEGEEDNRMHCPFDQCVLEMLSVFKDLQGVE